MEDVHIYINDMHGIAWKYALWPTGHAKKCNQCWRVCDPVVCRESVEGVYMGTGRQHYQLCGPCVVRTEPALALYVL